MVSNEPSMPGDQPYSFAKLRALPRRGLHPLRVYIAERGLTLAEAAKHMGFSRTWLKYVVTWRREVPAWKRSVLANALGFDDPDQILPPIPRAASEAEDDSPSGADEELPPGEL